MSSDATATDVTDGASAATGPVPVGAARAARADGGQRATLIGLLMVVTAVAFEALAVATVMPVVARSLSGLSLYGWAFTAFFITSIVGMVVAGPWSDRAGPVPAFISGLAVFAAGLLIAGSATSMPVFIAGRAVQGFGAGENIVALYVVIARVFAEADRPRVFSAISGAWVLPSVVGPAVAGLVAEHVGWRWVFYGLPPFVVAGLLLLVPALRGLGPGPAADGRRMAARWPVALRLAAGVTLLEVAGQRLTWWSIPLAGAGAVLLVPSLRLLLPAGALRLARGLPAVVVSRGLLAGAFFGAEAFLPLDLQTLHHMRPGVAGVPLTVGAIGWFAGSWYQGRLPAGRSRDALVRQGFALVTAGVAGLVAVTYPGVPGWFAVLCWTVGGAGMGLAMSTVGLLTLQLSPPGEQGVSSAALQISDAVGSTLCIAVGGALLAVGREALGTGPVLRLVFALMAAVAGAGILVSGRTRPAA
ncbi:MAG: MFS transporter [Frankiaceae bacterium]